MSEFQLCCEPAFVQSVLQALESARELEAEPEDQEELKLSCEGSRDEGSKKIKNKKIKRQAKRWESARVGVEKLPEAGVRTDGKELMRGEGFNERADVAR